MSHASFSGFTHAAEQAQKPVEPTWLRKKSDFVICVRNSFGYEHEEDIDKAIAAVFRLLDRHISHGEFAIR